MPQVHADPDELRRFIHTLQHFNQTLHSSVPFLQNQFDSLGDTWRDQDNMRYTLVFQETMQILNNFMRVTDAHVPYLLRKAQILENYLKR